MELLIKIPKEFEQHFKQDAFEDSLFRLCVDSHLIAGNYERETANMLIDAFKNAVPVPPHGDLIDRDALIKDGWLNLHKEVIRMGGYAIHELPLKNPSIPVIIPAEEGET